jgi:hypothetical protein
MKIAIVGGRKCWVNDDYVSDEPKPEEKTVEIEPVKAAEPETKAKPAPANKAKKAPANKSRKAGSDK